MKLTLLFATLLLTLPLSLCQAGMEEDWAAVVAMDSGPKKKPASREEAMLLARTHFLAHRKVIEAFLAKYPSDPRAFDARLRLASITATEGKMDGNPKKVEMAMEMFEKLENTPGIPTNKKADAGFHRVSLYMQNQKAYSNRMRENIVNAAQGFVSKYPGDRRGARLLVEVATICDDTPRQKRALLEQADTITTETELKARIADDLKRIDRLGQPLDFTITPLNGDPLTLSSMRGKVVVILFWSAASPPSLLWLRDFRKLFDNLPQSQLRVVTVSVDTDRKIVKERLGDFQVPWPTHFDGKGWESPLVRSMGINTLPTIWILDKKGVLRTLNARTGSETWIRQLLRE